MTQYETLLKTFHANTKQWRLDLVVASLKLGFGKKGHEMILDKLMEDSVIDGYTLSVEDNKTIVTLMIPDESEDQHNIIIEGKIVDFVEVKAAIVLEPTEMYIKDFCKNLTDDNGEYYSDFAKTPELENEGADPVKLRDAEDQLEAIVINFLLGAIGEPILFCGQKVEFIEKVGGGEGGSSDCYTVFKIGEKVYITEYYYQSYNGYSFDCCEISEAKPKVINTWEAA